MDDTLDFSALDAELLKEFENIAEEEPTEDEIVDESDDAIEEEVEEGDYEDDVEDETIVEEGPKPQKPEKTNAQAKSDAAMARMRIEKAESERIAKEQETFLNQLAAQAGFTDVSQFKEAVSKEISKKQAEAAGITPEAYEKMRILEERVNAMEAEKQQAEAQAGAQRFSAAVDKFVSDYKLGEQGKTQIFDKLSELGYEVDDLLIMKSPELFIKGAMADVIQSQAVQSHLKQKERKPKVDSERVDTSGSVESDGWEAALTADLEKYAKDNGY